MQDSLKKLEKLKVTDYLKQIMPGVIMDTIDNEQRYGAEDNLKSKVALMVPQVGQSETPKPDSNTPAIPPKNPAGVPLPNDAPAVPPAPGMSQPNLNNAVNALGGQPPQPQGILGGGTLPNKDVEELKSKVNEIYKVFNGYVSITELNTFKDVLLSEIASNIQMLNNEFLEFKKRLVPDRAFEESDVIYKNEVYNKASEFLDSLLLPLLDGLAPEYTHIAAQYTKFYDDGSVCNSLVDLGVRVPFQNIMVNYTVQIPILNGVMLAPLFLQRMHKLIPFMKEDIYRDLYSLVGSEGDINNQITFNTNRNVFTPPQGESASTQEANSNQKRYLGANPVRQVSMPISHQPYGYNNFKSTNTPLM
jgi:hypothetical protein